MKHLLYAAAGLTAVAFAPTGARTQDADFGCKILLCAASQNPSWQGVPYCVPPMKQLISDMAKPGFDWPICKEAKTGEPGQQEFEDCPAGSHPSSSNDGDDNGLRRNEEDQCVRIVDSCENRGEYNRLYGDEDANQRNGVTVRSISSGNSDNFGNRDNRYNGCKVQVTSPRPRRANPWYFDIPNKEGVKERFWFNLKT